MKLVRWLEADPNYRWLDIGETVRHGDMWGDFGFWSKVDQDGYGKEWVGFVVTHHKQFIRKIEPDDAINA